MTFLNATLMFGMAAIAVPIVLHLIAKREPKRVVFPSVRFLTKRFETNRSKLRVRRWWLLALRIAALAALAIALARPAIHRSLSMTWLTIGMIAAFAIALLIMATVALSKSLSKGLTYTLAAAGAIFLLAATLWGLYTYTSGPAPMLDESGPVAIAIVLDNAPTSAWKTPDDDRIDRMRSIANWMISRLPPTSRIAIVDRSSTPAAFSMDVASAVSKVDALSAVEATSSIASKIDASVRLVRTSELASRQVLVVTDLANPTWQESAADSSLVSLLAEQPSVKVTVLDLGEFKGTNRILGAPTMADLSPPKGYSVNLTSTIKIAPTTDATQPVPVTAELAIYETDSSLPILRNGKTVRPKLLPVDRTSVSVVPGGSSEIKLTIPPLDVGLHHGVIRLVGDDAMPLDNERFFTVQVLEPSRVLMVSDSAAEARVIEFMINATELKVAVENPEYVVEQVGYNNLPAVRLDDFDSVVLLDPPADVIAEPTWREFAAQGRGVLICLGPSAGEKGIESESIPTLVRRWRSPEPHTFFEFVRQAHPTLASLSEVPGGVPWNDYRVQQYWQLKLDAVDKTLIRFAGTTHPALVERDVKSESGAMGHIVICSTLIPNLVDENDQWNDLFGAQSWPAFYLVRNIVEHVSHRGAENWTSQIGQPAVVTVNAVPKEDEAQETRRLQLFPPGDTAPVPINLSPDATRAVAGDISQSGTYWLRGTGENVGFSANLPIDKTDVTRVDPEALNVWFGPEAYRLVNNQTEIELAEAESAQRLSLRSPLMLIALAVFLLEQILANRFYRRGDSTAKSPTTRRARAA